MTEHITQNTEYCILVSYNIAWKLFYPTKNHIKTAKYLAKNKGVNIFITGYPIADEILDTNRAIVNPWHNQSLKIKRIIWAPHHSITEGRGLNISHFLNIHQTMSIMYLLLFKKFSKMMHSNQRR